MSSLLEIKERKYLGRAEINLVVIKLIKFYFA